ncbi:Alpha/Beta hydrolase protein [Pavlovales sp. CCMP2436]|nr:Alpha/Beta hydrolase protein [Pavlovales sp. CCMP2436]|mmetsp:Transcript_213/g.573  ORF Transcript_213/g.573 Transcript_213/m.573 type:complete len:254 (+) Transcript_213:136-897(+)
MHPGEAEATIPIRRGGVCYGLCAERGTRLAIVACHPWGPLGGSMWDVVVEEAVDLFGQSAQLTTLRFNFRSGVGSGASSADDVRGACAYLLQLRQPPESIVLIGYSYGSLIVAGVAEDIPEVVAFACISPPLNWAWALYMCSHRALIARAQQAGAAKLLIIGEVDNFCDVAQFQRFHESLSHPKQAVILRGSVDHFNVYKYVQEHLSWWACSVFDVQHVAALATSSGMVRTSASPPSSSADDQSTPMISPAGR